MATAQQDIPKTDPNEKALDGTVGGDLDQGGKQPDLPDGGTVVKFRGMDMSEIDRRSHEAIEKISETIRTKRSELNAEKKSIISALESDLGFNPHAFDAFMGFHRLPEDKKANWMLTFQTLAKVMNENTQVDWIDEQEGQ